MAVKLLRFLTLLLFPCFLRSQTVADADTVITTPYYVSYCVKKPYLHSSYNIYKLYKENNIKSVSREKYYFHAHNGSSSKRHFNYKNSGYDKGHLVSAEDMSFSAAAMENSFLYINCVPQAPNLNRGEWRIEELKWHNYIYNINNKDTLIVIAGVCDYDSVTLIPAYCFKSVYSVKQRKFLSFSLYINNKQNNSNRSVKVTASLKQKITRILRDFLLSRYHSS